MPYTIHRYPTEWIDRWTMHDGSTVTVCPILPQGALLKVVLVEGLSSESCHMRLLVGGDRLTSEIFATYAQIDYVDYMALVVSVARPNGTGEDLIADGRFAVEDDVAEFAMLVVDTWQGKGVGWRLFAMLVRAARVSGAREVFGEVLSINRRMISLVCDVGLCVADVPGDVTVCTACLLLAQAEVTVTSFAFA